jgi:hypothetical protein
MMDITNKGTHMNTTEKYYIYLIYKTKHSNAKHIATKNPILDTISHKAKNEHKPRKTLN